MKVEYKQQSSFLNSTCIISYFYAIKKKYYFLQKNLNIIETFKNKKIYLIFVSMKFLKKLLKFLIYFWLLLAIVLYITDTDYLIKAVRTIYMKGHTTAFLEDYKEFDNQTIEASGKSSTLAKS